jgi:hypothetical protein
MKGMGEYEKVVDEAIAKDCYRSLSAGFSAITMY